MVAFYLQLDASNSIFFLSLYGFENSRYNNT